MVATLFAALAFEVLLGGCAGTSPTCTVSMTAARSVTASFKNGKGR